jgi:hypothetical protein
MMTQIEYVAAPPIRKAVAKTRACEVQDLPGCLQKYEAVKRKWELTVLEAEMRIALINARGGADPSRDESEMIHLAGIFGAAVVRAYSVIRQSVTLIEAIKARPDAACLAQAIDILNEEIKQLRLFVESTENSKHKIQRWFAED